MTNRLLPCLSIGLQQSLRGATTTSAKWSRALLAFLGLVFVVGQAGAQTTERGHETVRGELNFRAKAEYLRLHPEPLIIQWKDTARKGRIPLHLDPIDPTMLRSRPSAAIPVIPPSAPAPFMPVSPSPDTTFQSTLDNGTTIPPDTHGAIDSNYCVTAVNSAVRIQTRSGTSVSQISLNSFWSSVLPGGGAFDPRVHYDPYTNRWIMVAVSGAQSSTSSVLLAVSKTGNPTGDWWQYKITAYSAGDYWLDFPNVGINNKWITVSGVLFQNTGGGYGGCKTFIFDKSTVSSGASAPFTAITQTGSGNICPAITYSNTLGSMFMVEAWNGGSRAMRLWKITGNVGSESMTSIGFPLADFPWWYQPFPVSGTSFGDNAPQLGVSNKINNGDNRVTQLIYRNNSLWFAHTIFLPYNASANPTRSAVQWWQTDTLGNPIQIGRVDDSAAGKFFAYPTIAVNNNNDALIGFSVFSSAMRPSAGYALRLSTDATDSIRTPVVYRNGQNSYYKTYGGSKNRWGDYSATMVDPVNNTDFWTIQEASHSTINMWDTWWARVVPTTSCSTPSISGTLVACAGSGSTLTGSVSGGTWSSSNASVATVGSASGVVTAVAAGTVTISYTISGGCVGTAIYTVNALPATITGTTSVCIGSTTTLASTTGGGTWASSNSGVASVGSTGIVSGIAAGTATISYTVSGCVRTTVVTVNSLPATISGTLSVCVGATTTLSSATTGGTWATSASGIATVGSTGIVTGVAAGTSTISYTVSGCRRTAVVTVLATPAVITGSTSVCVGATTTLSSATSGGTWASSASGIATVGSTGIVTGVAAGTATISYTVSGCARTTIVTVLATPAVITGSTSVCAGATTTLSSATGGGTWASSATGTATVGSTGIVTGVASGTATISYNVSGCTRTVVVTVSAAPNAGVISGAATVPVGGVTTLTTTGSGGSWSSSNTAVGTISSSGVFTGISGGISTVSYTVAASCSTAVATYAVTVSIPCTSAITTIAGNGTNGYSGDGGPATSAQLYNDGVCTDAAGNLYIADYNNQRVRKVTPSGVITTICGNGSNTSTGDGGPASAATVNQPIEVFIDPSGNLYVSEYFGNRIRKINTSGIISTVAGTGSAGFSGDGGPATAAQLRKPSGMGMDAAGNLYFADYENHRVRKISTSGVITTIAGNGSTGYGGDGVSATSTSLYLPFRVAVDGPGNVYIGDFLNSRVRKVNTSGVITTYAGTGTNGFSGDGGPATSANISYAFGVTLDASNNLYIADYSNHRIRKVDGATGTITTVAGTGSGSFGGDGGPATAAQLSNPVDVEFDASGNMFIADRSNARVRKIGPASTPITGTMSVCVGSTTSLSNSTTGGVWTSSATGIATVGSTGIVTGVAAGTANIIYTTSCFSVAATVTVNSAPSAGTITGASSVCADSAIVLSNTVSGGSWSSSNSSIATVGSTGLVSGIAAGTSTISYTVSGTCGSATATKVVTVNAAPSAGTISGASSVFTGSTITLSSSVSGGTWSSGDVSIATVGSTGVVTGVSVGSVTISYTVANGCGSSVATKMVMVSESVSTPITGTLTTCVGMTTTLSNAATGGTWTSGNTSVATVGSISGIVTGVSGGTSTITYSLGGVDVTAVVSVYAMPAAISGPGTLCVGASISLTDATTGGVWTSSGTAVATIDSASGVVTGVSSGTAVISYSFAAGCSATKVVTVNVTPGAISGSLNGCIGVTNSFTCTPSGGAWSSSTPSVANINSAGQATGATIGTTLISYSLSSGCRSTAVLTINALPDSVTGTATVCVGLTTTFTGFPGGGTWSSSNTAVATINASGVITGVALGTSRITYTNAGGCYKTKVVTVNAAPLSITGTAAVCVGNTTTLACPGGGTWASSDMAVGTISSTGVVRGISGGITTITYTLSTGCFRTRDVTVNSAPSAITGTASICVGAVTTLNSTPSGGTWSSSGLTVGTVGSTTGVVTGLSGGVVTISYTVAGGCRATRVVTVNNNPPAISGTATLATGGTTTLSNALSGGSWSSGATGVATVGSTGIVFGVGAGTAVISYTSAAGCSVTRIVTVTGAVGGITGVTSLCTGATTSLSCSPTGGTWASSTTAVATVNSTGVVTGVAAGTSTISYTISGTTSTVVVTVYATPSAITGPGSVCVGAATAYSNAVGGGTWSSTNTSVATIGSTGTVTPIAAGTTTISYQMSAGCGVAKIITVNANPASITGASIVCVGASGSLSCATAGGAWSSSATSVATIDGSGSYSGVSAGVATITYTTGAGCYSTFAITVNPIPGAITGGLTECIGGTSTLSNTTSGGTWSSSNTAVGTIDASGVVTAITAGTTTISYGLGGTCAATAVFTVNSTPAAIGGSLSVCIGGNTTLTNPSSGGTWSSSTPAVGTISSGMGVFTGITSGVTTVTYTVGTGCFVTADVTVNALPGAISGTLQACASGGTTTLTCTPGGGVWSTTTPSVATIGSATGVVSGVISGTAVVTYTVGTGCFATAVVTINAIPATITGTATACPGTTTNLTSTTAGGNWTSSNTAAATVNSSGVVTGVAAGTTTISYELSGCATTRIVTVYPLPGAVTGSSLLCSGIPTTYTATPSGGTWSSGNTAVGTINITTGAFTGLTAGTTVVTYKLATGCQSELTVSVNATPGAISGATTICLGNTVALTSATSGGAWASSNTAVGTVNSSGVVTGITSGTTTISYTVGSCAATKVVTVNTVFASSSTFNMCIGGTKTLVDSLPGGTWSSSTPSIATVVSGTGVATALAVGMTTITYTFGTGCTKTTPLYVQNSSAVISGPSAICEGSAASMTVPGASSGGSWTSSNPAVATINLSTGAVNAVSPGVVTISYTLIECITTKVVTINPRPSTSTGNQFACVGLTTTLSNSTGGGSWVSSNSGIASVGSGTGVVTGVAAGVANISYTLPTGCFRSLAVTVAATPAAISGTTNVCVGNTITMANTSPGGTWSSSNAAIGSVNASTGVVGGVASGVATISYGYGGSCFATKAVTVNPAAAAITGPDDVCAGLTITLANAVTPGTWSSSAAGVATANASTGLITGVSAGTVNITYRTTAGGCTATKVVTVNAAMPAFTGGSAVCVGETITLANAVPGGTWSSSNTAKATIGSSSGVVTGVALGTTSVTYMVSTGCYKAATIVVNALPAAITGASSVVVGSSVTLACATSGGAWSSSNPTVATVGTASGSVTGVAPGAVTISYVVTSTGCRSTKAMTVNPVALAKPTASGGVDMGSVITVYPNPTQGVLTIESTASGNFKVFTLDSKQIAEYQIAAPSTMIKLPADMPAGIYMCRFTAEDGTVESIRLVYSPR